MLLYHCHPLHFAVLFGCNRTVFQCECATFKADAALADHLTAVRHKHQRYRCALSVQPVSVSWVIAHLRRHQRHPGIVYGRHSHRIRAETTPGLGIVSRGNLERRTHPARVQRKRSAIRKGAQFCVRHPQIADKIVIGKAQLGQADRSFLRRLHRKVITGVTHGHILAHTLSQARILGITVRAAFVPLQAFHYRQILQHPRQIVLGKANRRQPFRRQILRRKTLRVIDFSLGYAFLYVMGVIRTAFGDSHRFFSGIQHPAAPWVHTFRHGHSLSAPADQADRQPLAQKGAILRKRLRPGRIHCEYAFPYIMTLVGKIAQRVIPRIQLRHAGIQSGMVFGWVDGKPVGCDVRAMPDSQVFHVLHQFRRKQRQKGAETFGNRRLRLREKRLRAGDQRLRGKARVPDGTARVLFHDSSFFAF